MASADLRAELECSICLSIYADPVMLKCGHNFCRDCVDRVLDTQERSGGYSCPECRQRFQARPALQRNITLRNIAENFQSAQPDQNESGIFCTYCIHTLVPAVKSCVMCEASLCDNHLRVHSKSPEHVLCDPTTSLENRKCSVHKKILEYYCTEDSTYICVSCNLAGEHWGHQMTTMDEASEMKKKKLRDVLQKLMTETEETEKRVQSLQERRRNVQGKAADETERVTALFRDIKRQLEDLEKRVLGEISVQAERVSLSLDDVIQQLEMKKNELSRKMEDIEELCNMTDPLTVLQKSDTGHLCDTEDGDDERHDGLCDDGGDLDVAAISHTLHTGLSDIMSWVNVQECPGTHVYQHTKLSRPHHGHTPTVQRAHLQAGVPTIGALQQTLGVTSGVTDLLLDVSTAGNYLHISNDKKTVSWSSHQNRPETPGRFECDQVLSGRSFSSGHHYWEVDVGGSDWWKVGMCYASIYRRGKQSVIGCNKKSWCLERWGSKQYSVIHDSNKIRLVDNVSSKDRQGEQSSIEYNKESLDLEMWGGDLYSVRHDRKENPLPSKVFGEDRRGEQSTGYNKKAWGLERWGGNLYSAIHGRKENPLPGKVFSKDRRGKQPSIRYNKKAWGLEAWGGNQYSVSHVRKENPLPGKVFSKDRRGEQSSIGYNKMPWGLEAWGGNPYSVIHDRKENPLPGKVSSNRVRIDLDYEAGRISFYDLCDPIRHLHTFTTTFTEPLLAGIYVGEGCIKICGGNQM